MEKVEVKNIEFNKEKIKTLESKSKTLETQSKKDSVLIKNLEVKTKRDAVLINRLEEKHKKNVAELEELRKKIAKVSAKQSSFFISEFKKQTLTLSVAAFGFLAALTWRDAIGAWLAPLLQGREGVWEFTFIAIVVTLIAIFVPVILTKFLGEEKSE